MSILSGVRIFTPTRCPCGCKKWIMSPMFHCQCSSLTDAEKEELMDIVRDARRYRALRSKEDVYGQVALDAKADMIIVSEVSERRR